MTTPISNKALEKKQKVQKKKEILEFYKIILNRQGELLSREYKQQSFFSTAILYNGVNLF